MKPTLRSRKRLVPGDRLRRSNEVRAVFDRGKRAVGPLMVLWWVPVAPGRKRLAVVASKRTFPRAVDRNRAKRLLREAYRLNRPALADGHDMVLVGRRRILGAACADVERDLLGVARRAGLRGQPTDRQA